MSRRVHAALETGPSAFAFLWGEDGTNTLILGPGEYPGIAHTGAGDDQIDARNGVADSTIYCGEGTDRAVVDTIDSDVSATCETIERG